MLQLKQDLKRFDLGNKVEKINQGKHFIKAEMQKPKLKKRKTG